MSGFLISMDGDSAPNSVGALGEQLVQRVPNGKDWEGTGITVSRKPGRDLQTSWAYCLRSPSGIRSAFSHDPPPPRGLGQTSV